jgi:tetratricopeptide (TPR) repeat protein
MSFVFIGLLNLYYLNVDDGIKFLEKSYEFDNLRNEGIVYLAEYYHNIGNEKNVYRYTNLAIKNIFPRNRLRVFLLENRAYADISYHVLDLHSFAAYKLGYYNEAKMTCQKMIDNIQLVPEIDRERIIDNYNVFCNLCK